MINHTTKPKARQEKPALKVMHTVSKDGNGAPTITSKQLDPNPVKSKEATDSKPAKIEKPKDTSKDETTEEQRTILQALHDLGGKDVHSMDIAKKLGFDKTHKNAPRAPVRNAMERLHALHYVTSKKEGAKFSFSITEKGKEALTAPQVKGKKHDPDDVPDHMLNEAHRAKQAKEGGGDPAPKPSINERPANTDVQCQACKTWNPYMAEFCRECGKPMKAALIAA